MRSERPLRLALASASLAIVIAGTLLVPLRAGATDSDLKHAAVFKVKASNGFSILAFAASERADGQGDLGLIVYGKVGMPPMKPRRR